MTARRRKRRTLDSLADDVPGQMTIDDVYSEARARLSDPQTSHDAAASLSAVQLRASQVAVLSCLRSCGPSTDERLWTVYATSRYREGWPFQSTSGLRTRRAELVEMGHVIDSGQRARLVSGRQGIVWEVVR